MDVSHSVTLRRPVDLSNENNTQQQSHSLFHFLSHKTRKLSTTQLPPPSQPPVASPTSTSKSSSVKSLKGILNSSNNNTSNTTTTTTTTTKQPQQSTTTRAFGTNITNSQRRPPQHTQRSHHIKLNSEVEVIPSSLSSHSHPNRADSVSRHVRYNSESHVNTTKVLSHSVSLSQIRTQQTFQKLKLQKQQQNSLSPLPNDEEDMTVTSNLSPVQSPLSSPRIYSHRRSDSTSLLSPSSLRARLPSGSSSTLESSMAMASISTTSPPPPSTTTTTSSSSSTSLITPSSPSNTATLISPSIKSGTQQHDKSTKRQLHTKQKSLPSLPIQVQQRQEQPVIEIKPSKPYQVDVVEKAVNTLTTSPTAWHPSKRVNFCPPSLPISTTTTTTATTTTARTTTVALDDAKTTESSLITSSCDDDDDFLTTNNKPSEKVGARGALQSDNKQEEEEELSQCLPPPPTLVVHMDIPVCLPSPIDEST